MSLCHYTSVVAETGKITGANAGRNSQRIPSDRIWPDRRGKTELTKTERNKI